MGGFWYAVGILFQARFVYAKSHRCVTYLKLAVDWIAGRGSEGFWPIGRSINWTEWGIHYVVAQRDYDIWYRG